MLELILIGVSTGIVSRLAKSKGYDPVLFGILTVIACVVCAVIGFYFFGLAGDLLGVCIGCIIIEEVVRNTPGKPVAKKKVYCPQCGLQQDWEDDKLCMRCGAPLRK